MRSTFLFLVLIAANFVFAQAKKPTIMVLPSDNWCEQRFFMTEFDNQGTKQKVPNYKQAFQEDTEIGQVISKIGSLMIDRGFPLKDAEQELKAIEARAAFMIISKSGGARMMEAGYSLMQMAKVSGNLGLLSEAKLPYISYLTDPTTGGVTASFAMLGDINIAEPGALIGFAGPRVVKETIGRDLPDGFQTSEFLLEHGFLDFIIDRTEIRPRLSQAIRLFTH